jgi:hypothetical protein
MKTPYLRLATWLCIVICMPCTHTPAGAGAEDTRLVINDVGPSFELTVPVSQLILSVPKNGLAIGSNKRGGATESARYFYLTNAAEGVIISGWFEPAARYVDLGDSWSQEMEKMKKSGFPHPQDVERSEIGTWRAILYNYALPNGSSAHARASYVGAGTWIDLHASISSARPGSENRKQVEALVRSMQIREKP